MYRSNGISLNVSRVASECFAAGSPDVNFDGFINQ